MARIRSSKPEWWSKPKWCAIPRDIRSTYKGIWEVMADDQGRFHADVRVIKGQVWPLDDDITMKKIEKWLEVLSQVTVGIGRKRLPAVVLYVVAGVRYGFLPGFVKHQKISHPTPSKLPPPPEPLASDSGETPERFGPDVDVDGDIEGIRKTSTTAREAGSGDSGDFSRQLITAANSGMVNNPAIGEALSPIPFGHGASLLAAEEIAAAGVDAKFAVELVFEMAETFSPVGRNRQIKSIGYCTDRVIERWNTREAGEASRSARRPAAAARASKRNGRHDYDYSKPTESPEAVKWQP